MSAIPATSIDGKIVPDTPLDWPNGKRLLVVDVTPLPPVRMMTEEEQGDDPESIAKWIEWYDSLEPLVLTTEDEDRIRQAREDQRAFELARWEELSRKLERLFE